MNIADLPSTNENKLRRLGQGHGSGRGKTSGRGTKGQKARGKVPTFFEGGALPMTKRMPFLRGRGRNKIIKSHPVEVNISSLLRLNSKVVDIESLIKSGIIDAGARIKGAKLIGNAQVSSKLEVKISASAGAAKSITDAGGTVLPKS